MSLNKVMLIGHVGKDPDVRYLDHGVEFQLFTYREYDGVPEGTLVRDARAILPQEAVPFTRLTPGDFAVVKSKAEILGMQQNRVEIIKLLAAEQAVKNRLVRPQIGFCK